MNRKPLKAISRDFSHFWAFYQSHFDPCWFLDRHWFVVFIDVDVFVVLVDNVVVIVVVVIVVVVVVIVVVVVVSREKRLKKRQQVQRPIKR